MAIKYNCIHYYRSLLKHKQFAECGIALNNIIRTMRFSRHDKICGEDFSYLDFGNIPLNGIHFSMGGEYPCGFTGCKLNEWNFISGHSGGITSIAWSIDGNFILSGSDDCTAILWDANTGLMLHRLKGHCDLINSVAISPNGSYCLTGSSDGTAKLWNISTGKCIQTFVGHTANINSVSFSADSKHCITGSSDHSAKLWDIESGKCLRIFGGYHYEVRSVNCDGVGKFCLTGLINGNVDVWDAQSFKMLPPLKGHSDEVHSIAFSKDGKVCVTGSWDKTAILWRMEDESIILQFEGHTDGIYSVAISPDGKYCLTGSGDCTAKLWDAKNGKYLHSFTGHNRAVTGVAFSQDGKRCITASLDETMKIWSVESKECLHTLGGHAYDVQTLTFSIDRKSYLTSTSTGALFLREAETNRVIRTFEGHTAQISCVSFSPDSKYILTGSMDKTVRFWSVTSGECLWIIRDEKALLLSVAFSPSGKYYITSSLVGTSKVWNTATHQLFSVLEMNIDDKHALSKLQVASTIIRMHLYGNSIDIGTFRSIAFSPDGNNCLIGSLDGAAYVWDIKTNKCLHQLKGHTAPVSCAAFSSDGKHCITGSWDCTARIWNLETSDCFVLEGHKDKVIQVSYSYNQETCTTISKDGMICLWDCNSGIQTDYTTLYEKPDFNDMHPKDNKESDFSYEQMLEAVQQGGILALDKLFGKEIPHEIQDCSNLKKNQWKLCYYAVDCHGASLNKKLLQGQFDPICNKEYPNTVYCFSDFQVKKEKICSFIDKTVRISANSSENNQDHFSVFISSNGKLCLVCSYNTGSAYLWDTISGDNLQSFIGHDGLIRCIVSSPDGRYLLTGSLDETARIWRIDTGECINVLEEYDAIVHSVCFLLGYWIVEYEDGRSGIYEFGTGRCISILNNQYLVFKLCVRLCDWDSNYYVIDIIRNSQLIKAHNPKSKNMPESIYIATVKNIDGIHISGCNFTNVDANDDLIKILYQYGGDI